MNPNLWLFSAAAIRNPFRGWLIAGIVAVGCAALGSPLGAKPQAAEAEDALEIEQSSDDSKAHKKAEAGKDASEALASEESLARFQQLLEKRPFHGPAFTSLVSHHVERGKLADLVGEYAAKVEALPDSLPHKIVLARLHLRAGDAEKAAAIIEKIDQLPPDLARLASELLVFKSEVYQRVGNNEAAERMLKQALEQARSVSEQLKLGEALADLYLRDKRADDAAAALLALGEKFPGQYLHQKHIADALAQRGLHAQAVEHYRTILPLVETEIDKKCEVLRQLGMSLEKLDKRDDAIAAYVQAIGMLASDHWLQRELHERIVSLYRASGRLDDLAKYCQDQIARAPEQTAMRILLADVQSAMSQTDAAKATLEEAVTLFPADQTLSQKRIEFLERAGDIETASAEYQRIIGRHPGDPELYIGYGQFLANNRQVDAARNQWRHVLQTQVSDAMLASRLGSLFETHELYDDAAEAYERAVTLSPQQPEGYVSLSRLWLIRGDKEKAIAALQRAADANPNDGPIHAALANAMLNLGMAERALEAITKACQIMPDQVRFHQMRSDLLVQNGKMKEALEVRRSTLELMTNPVQQAEAINILVSMHATADKLNDLKKREEQRLADNAENPVSLLILARAADTERDLQTERAWLDELLAYQPNNEIALQQLAKLHDAVGDVDAAVSTYQRLIELHPARGRQYYENIVDLKLRYGDKSGAIETLDRMVKNDPGNANVLSAVAEQLVRMGDPELALEHYEKGLQLQPDRHDMRFDYGKALADAGRLEDAMQAFRIVATQRTDTDRAIEALGKLHDTATQLGTLEELIDELHTQVQTDPENTLVARALAALLIKEFEYGRAMELLNLVLKHNPRDVDIALARAELLRRLAQFDEAVAAYQQIVRFPQIDRDYVIGELGKAYFESGQVDQARRLWKQIQHKLYAGSLLKNNGLLEEAIAVLEEGIRLKPDDYALHRNLIGALDSAGKTDEALNAARRLLDLEPGNTYNIEGLAKAYLTHNNRAGAAEVAARLFSAGVAPDKSGQPGGSASGRGGGFPSLMAAMYQSMYSGYSGYYGGMGQGRSNLDKGINFFRENGLVAELEEVLKQQLTAQPDNSVLKNAAAELFASEFGKPEFALNLLQELETAAFPLEHQKWLGQCSQRDYMRVQQYNLIATMPALRDQKLAELEPKIENNPSRDDILAMAIIRQGQGQTDAAIELLIKAVNADDDDLLARGMLVDQLMAGEKFSDALPHASRLVEQLTLNREKLQGEMIERVRRDFIRGMPMEFQLRVTEELLADIARKWTLGTGFAYYSNGSVQTMGYLRARLTLATIFAETERMDDARAIWQDLAPGNKPDVDSWTMLGSIAQLHDQNDLAYDFYEKALHAAKILAGDPMMQQIYSSSTSQMAWYGGEESIDSSFNKIVEAFAQRDNLVQLYDFLRDTDQAAKAKRIAEQYNLDEKLMPLYQQRLADARAEFQRSPDNPLNKSVGYFAQLAKLTEIVDRAGNWPKAQELYQQYLNDFPDELPLITMLGEVAEAQNDTAQAIQWEKYVIECKSRLTKQARQWMMRELTITPAAPRVLVSGRTDPWTWSNRWRRNRWYYGSMQGQLERSPSWMRLAQLYLVQDNTIAAADAMQRAVADAASERQHTIRQVLDLIQSRQLTARMLPVLRNLAVYAPHDERVQLAFAEALEANQRKDIAIEVCNRMLRRGVSDLGVLGQVRRTLHTLDPSQSPPEVTLASLEAEVAADPANLKNRLRLAKAYYYALHPAKALSIAAPLAAEAPHLEDVHELLVEIHTLQNHSNNLIEALNTQISRTTDENKRRQVRWRLVDELLASGKIEDALKTVKELGDPRDPYSYQRIGLLLQYFGRHDDAVAAMEQSQKSQSRNPWDSSETGFTLAKCLIIKGDIDGALDKIMTAIDEQSRTQMQSGGIWGLYENQNSPFQALQTALVLHPELASKLKLRIEERHQANPKDPQATKLVMQMHRALGRPDLADALLERMVDTGVTDQGLMAQLIDRAVRRKDFAKAIKLAETFISQQPKPQLPPGTPPQYAGMMAMQSPRVFMVCKLGDVYWDMGQHDKAMDTYRQIIDDKIEETKIAYASICAVRNRVNEAKQIVDEALAKQQVKAATLLQFRAFIAALEGQPEQAFDLLKESAAGEADPMMAMYGRGGSPVHALGLLARRSDAPQLLDRFMAFMEERIAKNPHDWDNYSNLANALHEMGRPREALQVLDRAAAINSLELRALQQRGQWIEGRAPIDDLIALYEKMIELTDRNVGKMPQAQRQMYMPTMTSTPAAPSQSHRDRLGDLLWDKGEQQRAEKVWLERMNAQQAATHIKLGQLYTRKLAYDKAKAAFEKTLELDPENVSAHAAMADLAYHAGDRRALLKHMVACFVQNRITSSSQQAQFRSGGGESSWYEGLIPDRRMHMWAVELSRDPEIASYLAGESDDEAASGRLLLSLLTGDWSALEDELRRRIDAKTVDPLIWALWAQAQQRKGDWAEAARALDYLRRTKLTTIADHREKLKLVLAGKQIKEAAAGTRQAQPNMPGQPMQGRAYYPGMNNYGFWYGDQASDTSRLAGLYIKLGQFDKAERLYLISSSGQNVQYTLPSLAALMWEQRARDRALELMRLSVLNSTDDNTVPQYAGMMAEAGQAEAAIDLLIRGYRWNADASQQDMYSSMWGGGSDQQQLEQGNESSFSTALYDALRRSGKYEPILQTLSAEAESQPGDASLAKLIIALQIKDRRWEPLHESLDRWRKASPDDLAVKLEQLHVHYQRERWDDALELLNAIKTEAPRSESQWRMNEAFIALMRNDRAAAVAAVEAIIANPSTDHASQSQQILTVLAAAEAYEPLTKYLESLRGSGEIDDAGLDALFRAHLLQKRWKPALDLALEQYWRQQGVLEETSKWHRSLIKLVRAAEAAGAVEMLKSDQPINEALLSLVIDDPAKALSRFNQIAAQEPSSVNALRGQIFAATLANEDALVLRSNQRLIDLLEPKRQELWYSQPSASMQRLAQRTLEQMSQTGTTAMAMNGGASQLQQAMQTFSANAQVMTYEELWRGHQRLHRDLLAAAGDATGLETLLQQQARSFAASSQQSQTEQNVFYQGVYMPASVAYGMPNYSQPAADETTLARDWRILERQIWAKHHRMRELLSEFDQLKTRTPEEEWMLAAETAAALGARDSATTLQRQINDLRLNRLRSSDSPGQTQSNRFAWRWYGYGMMDQTANTIRTALAVSTADASDDDRSKQVQGAIDQLWELALIDSETQQRLLRCEPDIGRGWGATQTFIQLANYYRATQQFDQVIALFERAHDPEELLQSSQLSLYAEACLKAKSYDKFEKLLRSSKEFNISLENDVLLANLVMLRKQNRSADADALEKQLLAKCVVESPNPHRLNRLSDGAPPRADQAGSSNQRRVTYSYVGNRRYSRWTTDSAFAMDLSTVTSLAQALGVRYQPRVVQGDLTAARIRNAYLNHGLYADGNRLSDTVLSAQWGGRAAADDKYTHLWQLAHGLDKAGDAQAAAQAARDAEQLILEEIAVHPTRADWHYQLANLCQTRAYGRDYAKARAAYQTARRLDPAYDPGGLQAVHCLHKLGRHKEAWAMYREALNDGRAELDQEPAYCYAALSAHHAGDADAAWVLLRRALHRYPLNPLLAQAKELIHEQR